MAPRRSARLTPRRVFLFVAAAYLHLDEPAKAMELLERRFGAPGARKTHAAAFDYVAGCLAQ